MKNLFSRQVNSELCAAIRDDDLFSVISHLKNKDFLETPIDSKGNTPLLVGVLNKSTKTIRFLLSIGAQITVTNDEKLNAFDLASLNENRFLYNQLLTHNQLDKFLSDCIAKYPVISPAELKLKDSQKLIQIIVQEEKHLKQYSRSTGVYQKFDLLRTLRSLSMIAMTQNEIQFQQKLQNFFGRREEWIQNTEMDYCFSPHSVINKICFEAAKLLIPEVKQIESKEEEQKGPYDYLLQRRLTEERPEDWRQWQNNLECTRLLPQNIANVFCWREAESKFTYGELHYVPEILEIAIDNMKKGEISYERIWFKQDPKVRKLLKDKTPSLSRNALYIMRQWGESWRDLIDYSLNMDKIRKDPQSIMGRLNELCEGLYRGSKNGTGTEYKADVTARDSVGVFSEWFHSLEESDQKEIKNWSAPDLTRNIWKIMNSLQGSASLDEIIDPDFCVDILGKAIRRIIQVNGEKIASLQEKLNEKQVLREKTLLQKYKATHLKSAKQFDKLHQQALKEIQSLRLSGILINNTESDFGQIFEHSLIIKINQDQEPFFYELLLDIEVLSQNIRHFDLCDKDFLDMTFLCAAQQNGCLELFRSEIKKIFFQEIIEERGLAIIEILNYYPDFINETIILSKDTLSYTTPLILAAVMNKDKWTVKLLLEKGANILAMDSNNETAIKAALTVNNFEILTILNDNAQLLLRKALVENDPDTARKIAAINPYFINNAFQGDNLLTWALKNPHKHVLSLFLEMYPDIFHREKVLELGKEHNRLSELRDLAHKKFLDALKEGASILVKEILNYYPEFINEPCIDNNHLVTPLMLAVYHDREIMFQSLLHEKKLDLNMPSSQCDEKTERLVNNGLRKNRRVIHILQVVALSSVLINRNDSILNKILDKNPDFINSICLSGETPFTFLLNMAAKANEIPSVSMIEILLKKGASIFKKNEYGQHPVQIVLKHQWLPSLPIFTCRIRSDFYQAIKEGLLDDVKEILKYFPDYANLRLELSDGRFSTPLIVAVSEGNFDVVKFLIDRGADILAVDSEGFNAIQTVIDEYIEKLLYKPSSKVLEQALRKSDLDTVKKIFELNHDFNPSRIAKGETLLTFALKISDNNREIVQYLLEEKMDIFTSNALGEGLLKIAREKGCLEEFRFKANLKFSEAIVQGDLRIVEIILFYYPGFLNQPLAGENYENTPLMTAAFRKHEEIVHFFLEDSKLLVNESFILRRETTQRLTQDGTLKSKAIYSLLQAAAFKKVLQNKGTEAVYDIVLSTFPELLNERHSFLDLETPVTHAIKSKSEKVLSLVEHKHTNVFITNSQGQSPFYLVYSLHKQFLEKQILKNMKILEDELAKNTEDEVSNLLRIKLSNPGSRLPIKIQEIDTNLKNFRSSSSFFRSQKSIEERIKHLEYSILEYGGQA